MKRIITLLIGLVFSVVGAYLFQRNQRIYYTGTHVKAKIVGYDTHYSDGETMYSPIIQFNNQEKEEVIDTLGSSSGGQEESDEIAVTYLKKENKYEYVRDSIGWRIIFPSVFFVLGCIVLYIGIFKAHTLR